MRQVFRVDEGMSALFASVRKHRMDGTASDTKVPVVLIGPDRIRQTAEMYELRTDFVVGIKSVLLLKADPVLFAFGIHDANGHFHPKIILDRTCNPRIFGSGIVMSKF